MSTQEHPIDHRQSYSGAELEKHRGKWVAFSLDGSKVVAYGDSEIDLAKQADALGLKPADYIIEPIPKQDTVIL